LAEFIDTQEALDAALAALAGERQIALDTETDAFFAYRPAICLLQISVPGRDFVIDPLADVDMAGIAALLADGSKRVILHAAENDVILMRHQFGWGIADLFDTQVACFVLGQRPYSLAGVLEEHFGVKLDKSQQRSDWRRRPLSEKQLRYAALDTHYLIELADELRQRAEQAGRIDEIDYECRRIADRDWSPEPFDPEGFRRMSGAKELKGSRLRVLRDLFLFRNREAERRNRAAYRIAPDHALVALARHGADPLPRGVPGRFWERYGRRLRGVIRKAQQGGALPPRPRKRNGNGEPVTPQVKRRYERLRRWRTKAAEERGVETFVVARNELLMKIARGGCETREELAELIEPFRLREYGDAILATMAES
jgi:ribonuclease D